MIKFEFVPESEAPRNYFRRAFAIFVGILAFNGSVALLKRTTMAVPLILLVCLVPYSLVANLLYPFWRIRVTRR